jgi:predicted transposase/invertase (TIGR01784 family)
LDLSKVENVLKKDVEDMTDIEAWAVFFKYVTDEDKQEILNKILERREAVKMAKNILMQVSADEEARAYYESELIFELDQRGRFRVAKEEGIAEGITKGKAEAQIEIAKKMLLKNKSIDEIMEFTGLTEEEIRKIQDTLRK